MTRDFPLSEWGAFAPHSHDPLHYDGDIVDRDRVTTEAENALRRAQAHNRTGILDRVLMQDGHTVRFGVPECP